MIMPDITICFNAINYYTDYAAELLHRFNPKAHFIEAYMANIRRGKPPVSGMSPTLPKI